MASDFAPIPLSNHVFWRRDEFERTFAEFLRRTSPTEAAAMLPALFNRNAADDYVNAHVQLRWSGWRMHTAWVWGIDARIGVPPTGEQPTPEPSPAVALFDAVRAWLGNATDPAQFGAVHDEAHRARWRAMREAHAAFLATWGMAPGARATQTTNPAPGATGGPTTPP